MNDVRTCLKEFVIDMIQQKLHIHIPGTHLLPIIRQLIYFAMLSPTGGDWSKMLLIGNIISELCAIYMYKITLFSILNYHGKTYHLTHQSMNKTKTPGQPSEGFSEYITWVIFKCFWSCYLITWKNFHFLSNLRVRY